MLTVGRDRPVHSQATPVTIEMLLCFCARDEAIGDSSETVLLEGLYGRQGAIRKPTFEIRG
jgi:hypothetical protein